ncbi:MAG: hypothetical protein AAB563_02475 [Patescibacteria group bacterium]
MLYAQVIVKQRTQVQELTYALSAQIVPYVKVGSLVLVPLRRKEVKGVVVGFSRSVPKEIKSNIREIIKLDKNTQVFSSSQIEVIHKLSSYYASPLAEVAFHALDLPQIWPETKKINFVKPLILTGPWSQRRDAYERIIAKSTGRVLLIFSQNSYEEDFYQSVPASVQKNILRYEKEKSQNKLLTTLSKSGAKAIIGTMGEVFFPLQSGDTIIIDQPYHVGAKSQLRPFMTSRKIGLLRGEIEGLNVVLGDSIVSPEDLLAVKEKRFRLVSSKLSCQPLSILDRRGQTEAIVPSLMEEIANSITSKDKVLVLVMARGWASALVCQDCGYIFSCSNCHRTVGVSGRGLRCCYCATETDLPKVCPGCRSENLKPIGDGVSAVKNYLTNKFKNTHIQELSSDKPILEQKTQVVVATEKIFSFPNINFDKVYIVSADRLLSGTHLDDAWRLLGYLIELQNRSKQITVQTYFPDSIVWVSAATGNVRPFFAQELADRQQLNLPPYGAVIVLRGSSNTTEKLFKQAEKITDEILKILPKADISFPEVDDRSGGLYHGRFTIYLPKQPQNSLKNKIASILPPAWHLDID